MKQLSTPPVSIVMAAFNEEKHIDAAIRSVLAQTFTNYEFIIVDDGSTDRTPEIVQRYALADSRIISLRNASNMLKVNSMNRGFAVARGSLVAQMDADDISLPQRIEAQVEYFRQHPECSMLGTGTYIIDEEGKALLQMGHPETHEAIRRAMEYRSPFMTGSVMFRREPLLEVGAYDPHLKGFEDYELFLRLAEIGTLGNIPGYHYAWRKTVRGESNIPRRAIKFSTAVIREIAKEKRIGNGERLPALYAKQNIYQATPTKNRPSYTEATIRYYHALSLSMLKYGVQGKYVRWYTVPLMGVSRCPRSYLIHCAGYVPGFVRHCVVRAGILAGVLKNKYIEKLDTPMNLECKA